MISWNSSLSRVLQSSDDKYTTTTLTTEDVGSEGAAGDPQVVGVFLCMELVHVQVPQTQVSIGGAGHEYLTARAEGAGYHCCVIHCSGPSQTQSTAAAWAGTSFEFLFNFIVKQHMELSALPAQLFGGEIPQCQSAIRPTRNQVQRVRRERADPHRTAARMLQDGLDLTRYHGPDQRGCVGRTWGEELSAGAEAAAVDAVAMSRQRWERQLGEITGVVHPESFVPGACG